MGFAEEEMRLRCAAVTRLELEQRPIELLDGIVPFADSNRVHWALVQSESILASTRSGRPRYGRRRDLGSRRSASSARRYRQQQRRARTAPHGWTGVRRWTGDLRRHEAERAQALDRDLSRRVGGTGGDDRLERDGGCDGVSLGEPGFGGTETGTPADRRHGIGSRRLGEPQRGVEEFPCESARSPSSKAHAATPVRALVRTVLSLLRRRTARN